MKYITCIPYFRTHHNLSPFRGLLLIMMMGMSLLVHAGETAKLPKGERLTSGTTNGSMVINGTVVLPPPCTVNDDKLIEVEFNNVRTDLIDGESYASQLIPVKIVCTGTPSSQLQLELRGTVSATDSSVLETSTTGLGIEIQRDGSKFALNSKVNVSKSDDFSLTAVPIKIGSEKLSTGEFTATATLIVSQQ